ncbi:MAG: filamentous hemagglutinin N-terminal domain-containing protein, partial [Magnetococcus sp. YQC-5]
MNHTRTLKTLTFLLGLGYGLGNAELSQALPLEGQVVSGSAKISADQTTLQVNQSSDRTLIDWNSFGIHAGEKVIFKQPSADSLVVNRVLGQDLSSIGGSLSANGRMVLINPHGVIFQNGSLVNVGGLVATTRWLNTEDFAAGRFTFNAQDQATQDMVINRGVITITNGGSAVLAASHVENSGIIQAKLGRVTLAAGDSFTLNLDGDSLVSFAAPTTSKIGKTLAVINKGTIQADGGSILLTSSAAEEVVNSVVNIGGRVEAKAVDFQDGQIILHAGGGTATVSGTLEASGENNNQHGGTIQVLGNQIKLTETASLDASGHSAGGKILIGGDRHGDNPKIQNAKKTIIDKGATIAANANNKGDGGNVIVWSDANTAFRGQISTRGGENSGNGGFNEVSSKGTLQFDGAVNASAPKGKPGTLLLDPTDITIVTAGANAATTDVDQFTDPDKPGGSKIAPATLNAANANIILQATNDITFTDPVSLNAGFSLTAQAGRHVTVNNSITTSNAAIHLEADSPHTGTADAADGIGTLTIAAAGSLTTSGGKITLIGADFSILGTLNAGAGNVDIGPSRTGTNGNITIGSGILSEAELQKITSTGTVTIGKATTKGTDGQGTGATTPQSGTITLDASLNFSPQTFVLKLDPTTAINSNAVTITTNGGITFGAATTMSGSLTMNSNGGDITFNSTVDGTHSLTLTAGTGNVTFGNNIGYITSVGDLTIKSANNVTATGIKSAYLTQEAGTGTTTFSGAVESTKAINITANGGITFDAATTMKENSAWTTTGGNIRFNSTVNTSKNLTLTAGTGNITFVGDAGGIDRLGTVTINSAQNISTAGIQAALLQFTGTGTATLNGAVDSSGAVNITANNGITFGSTLVINDNSTFITSGGNIRFNSTVDGNKTLTLTAGAGDVTFSGNVGYVTRLGNLTIESAKDITATGIKATGLTQNNGSGSTTLNGIVDSSSTVSITANGGITLGSALTLNGPVTLITANNDITFNDTLNSAVNTTQNLTMTAGTGNITFAKSVGATTPLGTITINSAKDVTASSTMNMNLLTQSAGSGTTTFTNTIRANAAGGLNLTGTNFSINSNVDTLTAAVGGTLTITNSGLLTISSNTNINLDGAFTQQGTGTAAIGGSITTTNDTITFNKAVTLGANTTLTGSTVSFGSTLDASTKGKETLAIIGAATFSGLVGNTKELGALSISDVSTFNSTATSVKTDNTGGGSGNQTYSKAVTLNDGNTSTTFTMTSNAGAITFSDKIDGQNAGKALLNVNTSGTTTFGGAIGGSKSLASLVTDTGGATKISGGAITTSGTQTYNDAVTLASNTTLTNSTVTFVNTVDATTKGAETLTITGAATFSGLVGNTKELGALSISD